MDFLKLQIVEQQHLIDELSKVPARPVPPHSAAGPPAPGRACPPAPPERSASPPLDQRDRLGSPGRDGAEGLTPLLSLDPAGAGRAPYRVLVPGNFWCLRPLPRLSSRGSGFFSAHSATRLRAGLLSASMSSCLFPNEPTVPGSGGWGVSLSFLGPHPPATSSPGPRQRHQPIVPLPSSGRFLLPLWDPTDSTVRAVQNKLPRHSAPWGHRGRSRWLAWRRECMGEGGYRGMVTLSSCRFSVPLGASAQGGSKDGGQEAVGGPPDSNRELERLGPGGSGLPGARSVLSRLQLLLSPQTLETAGYVKSVLVSAPGRPGRWFLPVRHSRPPCTLGGFCDCCAASQRLCLVAEEAHTEARDMANAPVGFWRCPRELPLWSLFRAGSPLPGPSPHGFSTPSMDPGLSLAGSPWSHSCSPAPWRNQLIGLLTCGRGLSTVPMPSCRHICSERARGGLALHPPRLSISVCTAPPCPGSSSRLRRKLQHRELRATQRAERCPIQPSANRPEQTLRQCLWTVGPSQGHL